MSRNVSKHVLWLLVLIVQPGTAHCVRRGNCASVASQKLATHFSIQIYMRRQKLRLLANSCYALWQLHLPEGRKIPVQGCRSAFQLARIFLLITSYKFSIFFIHPPFLDIFTCSKTSLIRAAWDQGVSVPKIMPITEKQYVYCVLSCTIKSKKQALSILGEARKG